MKLNTLIRRIFNRPCAIVRNDASERIESLRFTVPALRVGVLEYAPGQLITNNKKLEGKTVKLYYPPEAVSDKNFLKSLEAAPVVVGGHNSTTNEDNKKIDGWAHTVGYDNETKAAMISGIVKGNKEVAYIKGNLKQKDFGASAFVDIFDMEIKNGVTPDGQEYNAIAKELRANHVALAPHVRDPQNKIRVTNAVVINTGGIYKSEGKKQMEITVDQISAIVENSVTKAVTAKNESDRIDIIEEKLNRLLAWEEEEKKARETAGNECGKTKNDKPPEDDENKKGETLEDVDPSQELIDAVGKNCNSDFKKKTPSFATLANLLGIKETDPVLRIAAVNARYEEIKTKKNTTVINTNSVTGGTF